MITLIKTCKELLNGKLSNIQCFLVYTVSKDTGSFKDLISLFVLTFITLILFCFQGSVSLTKALEYNYIKVINGEFWRILTSQLVHFSWQHALNDLILFYFLSFFFLKQLKKYYIALVSISLFIPIVLLFIRTDILFFRGISAIDISLWVFLFLYIAINHKNKFKKLFSILLLVSYLIKLIYEIKTGLSIFTSSHAFETIAEVHLIGGLVGLLIFSIYVINIKFKSSIF